jgi:hypothetical protein
VKKGLRFDIPDAIIAHLTKECGGNVHTCHVVDVTSGSYEKVTQRNRSPAKNAADLETSSDFCSDCRDMTEAIPYTKNNWVCYDFKERRIVPTHYTIRTFECGSGCSHLKSWVLETSLDGESWREVSREEDNNQLNGEYFTGTFAVAGGGECRFIRLVNIGRNHKGSDKLKITAWEIFGSLLESRPIPPISLSPRAGSMARLRAEPQVTYGRDHRFQFSLGSCGMTGAPVSYPHRLIGHLP